MVLCLLFIFLAVNFDWSIILIRKIFGASRNISGKLGVKLAISIVCSGDCYWLLVCSGIFLVCSGISTNRLIYFRPNELQ